MSSSVDTAEGAKTRPYLDGRRLESGVDEEMLRRLAGLAVVAPGPRESIEVTVPFTGQPLGRVPHGLPADVERAVRRARAAQPAWAATTFAARAAIFLRFHDLLLERQDQILDLVQLEAGKSRRHAFEEVLDTAIVARHYAHHAEEYLRPRRREGALPGLTTAWEHRHPVGVVGYVVPWNYPLNLLVTDAIPALMAGNTAVAKPDHQTSFTALWAAGLLYEAGLPRDVLQVVTGIGPELGPALAAEVDFLMFTGSTRTGKEVAALAARRLVGVSLELGGKNPMIVLDDADLEAAVDGACRGCFVGAGQVCVSIERIYVPRPLFERFVTRFAEKAGALRVGPALDYGPEIGSLASERQLATVEEHVRDALEKGATVRAGGHRLPALGPLFYAPTLLTGVAPGMLAYAEETFGPVVSVYPYDTVDQAVEMANDTRYGLSASVWSRDTRRAVEVATRIRAGSVNVNEAYAATWASVAAPIGGMKESGISRRHGAEGILKYTEAQTVAVQRGMPLAPPPGLSEGAYVKAMTRLLKLMRHVPGLR
jgi:acyl-CoA reductase-like NAD-dependent aldehyde dehydrogenase